MVKRYLYAFISLLAVAILSVIGHNLASAVWGESSWLSASFFYLVFIALSLAIISFIIYLVRLIFKKEKPLQ
ncbi:hypothetical protein KJ665_02700 [Patescibacteria group bacterium]|nr:hypothetical protein [Patescibacteria group bacterium]